MPPRAWKTDEDSRDLSQHYTLARTRARNAPGNRRHTGTVGVTRESRLEATMPESKAIGVGAASPKVQGQVDAPSLEREAKSDARELLERREIDDEQRKTVRERDGGPAQAPHTPRLGELERSRPSTMALPV
jgi:hypothetical protein